MASESKSRRTGIIFAWIGFIFLGGSAATLHLQIGSTIEILNSLGNPGDFDKELIATGLITFLTVLPYTMVLIPLGGIILLVSLISISRNYAPKPTNEPSRSED